MVMDEALGDYERADVLIEDRKIAQVGPDLDADTEVLDCVGKIETGCRLGESPCRGDPREGVSAAAGSELESVAARIPASRGQWRGGNGS